LPSKCEEKLVDTQRYSRQTPAGYVWIDNGANISIDMAAQVQKKACRMQTVFEKHATDSHFEGQVGFIRSSATACTPVTALHNITQVKDHVYSRSSAIFPDNIGRVVFAEADTSAESFEVIDLASPTADMRDDDPRSLHIAKYSFDKARQDFQYKTGQKVGIAVYSDTGATPKTAGTVEKRSMLGSSLQGEKHGIQSECQTCPDFVKWLINCSKLLKFVYPSHFHGTREHILHSCTQPRPRFRSKGVPL
jgi:hypothetical protein